MIRTPIRCFQHHIKKAAICSVELFRVYTVKFEKATHPLQFSRNCLTPQAEVMSTHFKLYCMYMMAFIQACTHISLLTYNRILEYYVEEGTHYSHLLVIQKGPRKSSPGLQHSVNTKINPLAPEFPFKFQHTLYIECE